VSRSARRSYQDEPVSTRLKLSALWVSMLFVFAYVDLFSLYRPDFRADVESGRIGGFDIGQTFLLLTTLYIVLPSLMVFVSLVLPPAVNRMVSLILAGFYGLTILGGAIGEWNYYIVGSVIEIALLGGICHYAWTWPEVQRTPD